MSFSSRVKEELVSHAGTARHCQIAEIAAMISLCGRIVELRRKKLVIIHTENISVAKKYFTLMQKTFSIVADVSVRRNAYLKKSRIYTLAVQEETDVMRVTEALKLEGITGYLNEQDFLVNGLLVQSSCCKRAFIRGAFLTAGSVTDPKKSYHLEVVFTKEKKALALQEMLGVFGIDAKIVARKKYFVLYIKEGRQIVDILNVMEAHISLMELENVRILKEISGSVNRQVNCETANINKTVSAAVGQINDIKLIRNKIGLEKLPEDLEQTALTRLEHPDATLKELGDLLSPPVGKSGVNHRLRKLKLIADSIRGNEEEQYGNKDNQTWQSGGT